MDGYGNTITLNEIKKRLCKDIYYILSLICGMHMYVYTHIYTKIKMGIMREEKVLAA